MNTSANVRPDIVLWAQMKEHYEGYRAHAYADTGGVWTVGFGSTYNHDKGRKVQRGDIVTRAQAERWMEIDQAEFIRQANQYIRVRLNSVQSTAICDYIYNRGIGNFLRTQLDELINANPNDRRIFDELLNTGIRDRLGNTLWGLGRRRRSQAWLYFTGQLRYEFPRWGALKLP